MPEGYPPTCGSTRRPEAGGRRSCVDPTALSAPSESWARTSRTQHMTKHPFRVAIETGASNEKSGELFSPNVVLWAPMLTKPVTGASKVLEVIGHAAKVAGPIRHTLEA